VRGRDNYEFDGKRLRVEVAKGAQGPPSAPPNWKNKGTGYRILVEDLPKSASWQDLKVRLLDKKAFWNACSRALQVLSSTQVKLP
jgi:hypothetical protein